MTINLSIIIPHYNTPLKLKKLLMTIPNKKDIQVVVIDDCSTKYLDTYVGIKNEFPYVDFLSTNSNSGAGKARNIGISEALGKWLLFADADDYFLENAYEKAKLFFDSGLDVIFFYPQSIDLTTNTQSDRHLNYVALLENYKKDTSNELQLKYGFVVPWSKMIRKDLIIKHDIKFDEVIASNDIMFSVFIGHYMKSFYIEDESIYCVTKDTGTLTKNINKEVYRSRLDVVIRKYNFLKNRLSKKEFKSLNLNGRGILIMAWRYDLGKKELFNAYRVLKKNKIKILELKLFNPIFVVRKTIFHLKKRNENKKYYVK